MIAHIQTKHQNAGYCKLNKYLHNGYYLQKKPPFHATRYYKASECSLRTQHTIRKDKGIISEENPELC